MSFCWLSNVAIESLVDDVTVVRCNCQASGCNTKLFYGSGNGAVFVQLRFSEDDNEEAVKLSTADEVADFIVQLRLRSLSQLFVRVLEQDLPVLFAREAGK